MTTLRGARAGTRRARLWHDVGMDVAHVIQSALAPVFLISGVGVMLGVLTNRLARIVDRARAWEAEAEKEAERAADLEERLQVLARRARYISSAITMCAISALLVALVVVALFANAFLAFNLSALIAILFVAAMLTLTAAFLVFLIEVRIATAAIRIGQPR
jgi:CBS domain containing-hemolysin-like protein